MPAARVRRGPVAIVCAALALLAGAAVAIGPRDGPASCSTEAVRPFACAPYALTAGGDRSVEVTGWFDTGPSGARLVIDGLDGLAFIPVDVVSGRSRPAVVTTPHDVAISCDEGSQCGLEQRIAQAVRGGAVLEATTTGFSLRGGGERVDGTAEAGEHRYPDVGVQRVGGRTLLVHRSTGTVAQAFQGGILGTSSRGCITAGGSVLVLPDSARLLENGAVRVDDRTVRQGEPVDVAGGTGVVPADMRCGTSGYWWY